MLRSLLCACLAVMVCGLVALAEEYRGIITKVDPDKGTVTFIPFKDKMKGEEKTMPVSKDFKVVKGKFNPDTKTVEAGDPIEGGLKADVFTKSEKGTFGTIKTDKDDKTITEILIFQRKGKGGDKGDK